MVNFLVHVCVVSPLVSYLVSKKRSWSAQRGLMYAVLFLGMLASYEVYSELAAQEPNYYEILQVHTSASQEEVKRSYRMLSVLYHPDKNPTDPLAAENFQKLRSAYEVLSNVARRSVYSRYGEDEQSEHLYMHIYIASALFYVMWFVLGYLLTIRKSSGAARQWAFAGLVASALVEVHMRESGASYLDALFPYKPVFQQVSILRCLYPSYFNGALLLCSLMFVDTDLILQQGIASVLQSNMHIATTLQEIRNQLGLLSTGDSKAFQDNMRKLQQEQAKLMVSTAAVTQGSRNEKERGSASGGNWSSILIMAGMYFLVNYVLK
eukprot:GILJ01002927.1.p1 GENE.GILJ01002927.1~~GILJ01002927.1.p1  ORF type:complete len:322 (+),score=38.24 GILJ01002927.1:30-995(+)